MGREEDIQQQHYGVFTWSGYLQVVERMLGWCHNGHLVSATSTQHCVVSLLVILHLLSDLRKAIAFAKGWYLCPQHRLFHPKLGAMDDQGVWL